MLLSVPRSRDYDFNPYKTHLQSKKCHLSPFLSYLLGCVIVYGSLLFTLGDSSGLEMEKRRSEREIALPWKKTSTQNFPHRFLGNIYRPGSFKLTFKKASKSLKGGKIRRTFIFKQPPT